MPELLPENECEGIVKLFKDRTGLFAGADVDSIKRLDKIQVGEVIEVEPVRREVRQNRSTKQNRYYWGVVVKTLVESLHSGLDEEQIHTALKVGCFGAVEVFGCMVPARSTKSLNTAEMEDYLSWVRSWAGTRSIYIPAPNECGCDY